MTDAAVLFEELPAQAGKKVAVATLNAEKTLNSLTLAMVDLLYGKLLQWQQDDAISCVMLQGAGPKAFCAGGDIKQLYPSGGSQPGGPSENAETFFSREYRLDYLLHTYSKPVVCWGHGIVMGGGLGLMAGCSHRVVTERTRVAMPEITIGLFPDVGASWFLNRMPGRVGLFLALTAAQMNAADCIYTGIADHCIESGLKDAVIEQLLAINWQQHSQHHSEQLSAVLTSLEQRSQAAMPGGQVAEHLPLIQQMVDQGSIYDIVDAIIACQAAAGQSGDSWLATAAAALKKGSPLSACVIAQALKDTRQMTLAEVFQYELVLAGNMVRHPDFAEGVRALLIDKDNKPDWQFSSVRAVPASTLQQLLTPPWPVNPLADL